MHINIYATYVCNGCVFDFYICNCANIWFLRFEQTKFCENGTILKPLDDTHCTDQCMWYECAVCAHLVDSCKFDSHSVLSLSPFLCMLIYEIIWNVLKRIKCGEIHRANDWTPKNKQKN